MLLSELFKRLSCGELSNLAVSQEGSGVIAQAKHPQLVRYTNEALLRLYSRFQLAEKSLVIEQEAHITSYRLEPRFAESSESDEPYHFIKDKLGEPFTGDVIKILEVHDSLGREFPINDGSRRDSVFTPFANVLQVPRPIAGVALSVLYQARHPILVDTTGGEVASVLGQEVNIPFSLESALQALIASSVYSHMNGQENVAKSQEFLSWAESVCSEVSDKDLVSQSNTTSHEKFEQRGFV